MTVKTTSQEDDLNRLRQEYRDREHRFANTDHYSLVNIAYLYYVQQYLRHMVDLLQRFQLAPLSDKRMLEVGCGNGSVLIEWLRMGMEPWDLHGIDLLPNRLEQARSDLAGLPLLCADGRYLPYPSDSFDIVLQSTVFSSILDPTIRQMIVREMLRVLRPNGAIIWYDFWLNPTNKQTRGLRPHHLRALFPDCDLHLCRVTLAPPLARRLVPLSWTLALLLEKLKIFNTHYLALIQPKSSPD